MSNGIRIRISSNEGMNITPNYIKPNPSHRKLSFMEKIRYIIKFWRNN